MMKNIPRTVLMLGLASFFTDFSSEMIYPLLPIFLVNALHAGPKIIGIIEGIAESTASILKVVSGVWTDRSRRRKPLILFGYGLAGLVRPLIGLATVWPVVLALRFLDRIGKGLRTSPRDALIADVTDPSMRGRAYGLHRSMDHAGAVVGPLVAALLLTCSLTMSHIFFLAAIPAVIVMVVLIWGIKETPSAPSEVTSPSWNLKALWSSTGRDFRFLMLALLVFTLGNSTDAFLLLRMNKAGVSAEFVALLWAAHHLVKVISTYIGGHLSDRLGRRKMVVGGWVVYAGIYFAFAFVDSRVWLIVIFLAYGIYFGLTEPSEKAWVSDLVPKEVRGTAFGLYNAMMGIGALPASVLFGFLWDRFNVETAFLTGAGLAAAASALLFFVRARPVGQQAPA